MIRLPRGNQTLLGFTGTGLSMLGDSTLKGLLRVSYSMNAMSIYDEVFEILRSRGTFAEENY